MGDVDFDDPNWETREYDKFIAYGASKTADILHMVELDRRPHDAAVHAYCVHPGNGGHIAGAPHDSRRLRDAA